MSTTNPRAVAQLLAYLRDRYREEIAGGWTLAMRGSHAVLIRGPVSRSLPLPPHLRPVEDAEAWHAAHQSGQDPLAGDLPLFATPEDHATAQGSLL